MKVDPYHFSATMDKYEVGDISGKFGNLAGKTNNTAKYVDTQMALYGSSNNILDRALVIHKNDALSTRWVCSNIVPDNILKSLSATANFTTTLDLEGYVKLVSFIPCSQTPCLAPRCDVDPRGQLVRGSFRDGEYYGYDFDGFFCDAEQSNCGIIDLFSLKNCVVTVQFLRHERHVP